MSKWHMNKLGVVDFWFYVNEEFYFDHGHMLLRGSNGSGKSVTMQSFIPLLLDGNKSSERLDAFGSKSRKLESYLLDEQSGRDDRIGYLYIEFKREDSEIYKTIGMGMRARKGKPLDSWYFVIDDNRRINKEISLYDGKLAITKLQLRNILGSQYIEGQKAYMERVNQSIFGFASNDIYKEAIDLILKLRMPKLSNTLKPTAINEMLRDSLQPLSQDELRPMSEAISNMDSHHDNIETLKTAIHSSKSILFVFDKYNEYMLYDKYQKYNRENKDLQQFQKLEKENNKLLERKQLELDSTTNLLKQLNDEQLVLQQEEATISNDNINQLYDQVQLLEKEKKEKNQTIQIKQITLENKEDTYRKNEKKLEQKNYELSLLDRTIHESFLECNQAQKTIGSTDYEILKQDLMTNLTNSYEYGEFFTNTDTILGHLLTGLQLFQEYELEKKQLDQKVEQIESYKNSIEEQENLLKQATERYEIKIEEYKENIYHWNAKNKYLKLDQTKLELLISILCDYLEENNYRDILTMISDCYLESYQDNLLNKSRLKKEQEQYKVTLLKLDNELEYWQNMITITPKLTEKSIANRKYLKQNNISYQMFYELFEFKEDVEDATKKIVEEIFFNSGLLYSLVVRNDDREVIVNNPNGMSDNYIFVDQLDVSACYLTGNDIKSIEKQVNDYLALRCPLHAKITWNDQTYRYGFLEGTLSKEEESIYIGNEARTIYRQTKINMLSQEIEDLENKITENEKQIMDIDLIFEALQNEKNSFLLEEDLKLVVESIHKVNQTMEVIMNQIQELSVLVEKEDVLLKQKSNKIKELGNMLQMHPSKENFTKQVEGYRDIQKNVREIQVQHNKYVSEFEIKQHYHLSLEELEEDVLLLKGEIYQTQNNLDTILVQLISKNELLKEAGFEDIKERLEVISKRLHEIKDLIIQENVHIGSLRTSLETTQEQLNNNQKLIISKKENTQLYQSFLYEELELFYVFDRDTKKVDYDKCLKEKYSNYEVRKNPENLALEVQAMMNQHRVALQENNLLLLSIFPCDGVDDLKTRIDIKARYAGQQVSLEKLKNYQLEALELEEVLLLESDKNLFEDILVNTVSQKIRKHIQSSLDWVEKMNRYMRGMDTSSGLSLSLKWEKRTSDGQEQLHTRELITLLQADPQLLKPSDRQKLSNHFRVKIDEARKQQMQTGNLLSFHQLMQDAIDYRQWFDFKIMTQKTGENKKELTNNLFNSYSGGEKAMSMYVPLFSAVAAKFENARSDSPVLIALDEAFAGIDEKNINNMFELIAKFDFDYIINSQVLWGDYPAVKNLAIYDLYRPENAKFVTMVLYKWNGTNKRMLDTWL
ncbi:TIGR02680 family protein [Tannockella kyphosi]|uniref:TIGR02680 family protein n=1 Tax=Tannockella kyphosi TaxID=2899121 RepID=UPI0020135FF7|nr:TIGR02680 family protein [Tannockella kyphosi]